MGPSLADKESAALPSQIPRGYYENMYTQHEFWRRPAAVDCPAISEDLKWPCPLHKLKASGHTEGHRTSRQSSSYGKPPLVLDVVNMPTDLVEVLEARDRSWTEMLELLAACQDCKRQASRIRIEHTLQAFKSFRPSVEQGAERTPTL